MQVVQMEKKRAIDTSHAAQQQMVTMQLKQDDLQKFELEIQRLRGETRALTLANDALRCTVSLNDKWKSGSDRIESSSQTDDVYFMEEYFQPRERSPNFLIEQIGYILRRKDVKLYARLPKLLEKYGNED